MPTTADITPGGLTPVVSHRVPFEAPFVVDPNGSEIRIPGMPPLYPVGQGDPPRIRWVSVTPDGHWAEHWSDNHLAADDTGEYPGPVQWRLFLDVQGVVDPVGRCLRSHGGDGRNSALIEHPHRGLLLIEPCRHHDPEDPLDPVDFATNRAASRLLARLTGTNALLFGTVALLGHDGSNDIHPSLGDDVTHELSSLIAEKNRSIDPQRNRR